MSSSRTSVFDQTTTILLPTCPICEQQITSDKTITWRSKNSREGGWECLNFNFNQVKQVHDHYNGDLCHTICVTCPKCQTIYNDTHYAVVGAKCCITCQTLQNKKEEKEDAEERQRNPHMMQSMQYMPPPSQPLSHVSSMQQNQNTTTEHQDKRQWIETTEEDEFGFPITKRVQVQVDGTGDKMLLFSSSSSSSSSSSPSSLLPSADTSLQITTTRLKSMIYEAGSGSTENGPTRTHQDESPLLLGISFFIGRLLLSFSDVSNSNNVSGGTTRRKRNGLWEDIFKPTGVLTIMLHHSSASEHQAVVKTYSDAEGQQPASTGSRSSTVVMDVGLSISLEETKAESAQSERSKKDITGMMHVVEILEKAKKDLTTADLAKVLRQVALRLHGKPRASPFEK